MVIVKGEYKKHMYILPIICLLLAQLMEPRQLPFDHEVAILEDVIVFQHHHNGTHYTFSRKYARWYALSDTTLAIALEDQLAPNQWDVRQIDLRTGAIAHVSIPKHSDQVDIYLSNALSGASKTHIELLDVDLFSPTAIWFFGILCLGVTCVLIAIGILCWVICRLRRQPADLPSRF